MVNYPTQKKTFQKTAQQQTTSRRGMSLEDDLNTTNQTYLNKQLAIVYKKPTPIQIVKVDYPSRNKAKITEAYFRQASTTDYNGVYQGNYLDFEAKETKNKRTFPLSLIHKHQINHLRLVEAQQAISFVIIRFSSYNESYVIFSKDLLEYIKDTAIKSLTYDWIKENGYLCEYNYQTPCHYLPIVIDEIIRRKR